MAVKATLHGNTIEHRTEISEKGFVWDLTVGHWYGGFPNLQPAVDAIESIEGFNGVRATVVDAVTHRLLWWEDYGKFNKDYPKVNEVIAPRPPNRRVEENAARRRRLDAQQAEPSIPLSSNQQGLDRMVRNRAGGSIIDDTPMVEPEIVPLDTETLTRQALARRTAERQRQTGMGLNGGAGALFAVGADGQQIELGSLRDVSIQISRTGERMAVDSQGHTVSLDHVSIGRAAVNDDAADAAELAIRAMGEVDALHAQDAAETASVADRSTLNEYMVANSIMQVVNFVSDGGVGTQVSIEIPRWLANSRGCSRRLVGHLVRAEYRDYEDSRGNTRRAKMYRFIGHNSIGNTTTCHRCSRELTHPVSQVVGYGPECCARLGISRRVNMNDVDNVELMTRLIMEQGVDIWLPVTQTRITQRHEPENNNTF